MINSMFFEKNLILHLAEVDAEIIEISFKINEVTAILTIRSSISCFIGFLELKKGKIILPLDIDYRVYITSLLSTLFERLSEHNKRIVFQEMVLKSWR